MIQSGLLPEQKPEQVALFYANSLIHDLIKIRVNHGTGRRKNMAMSGRLRQLKQPRDETSQVTESTLHTSYKFGIRLVRLVVEAYYARSTGHSIWYVSISNAGV